MTGRASEYRAKMRARQRPAQQQSLLPDPCPICDAAVRDDCQYDRLLKAGELVYLKGRPRFCPYGGPGELPEGF